MTHPLEAENRALRSVLGYVRQCIVREYPTHPQKGLKQALLGKIDAALAAEPASGEAFDGPIMAQLVRNNDELRAALAEATKAENEACAKIAESFMDGSSHATLVADAIAAAIRVRLPKDANVQADPHAAIDVDPAKP